MQNTTINNKNYTEIDIWKKKLLDLGKRNNLINYKDSKTSTLEILLPSYDISFNKIISNSQVQIFDDKFDYNFNDIYDEEINGFSKEQYYNKFKNKVPQSQILLFNPNKQTKRILNTLMKKASDSITERGVNILYIAYGFIVWKENDNSEIEYKAPILLMPITISNDGLNKPYFINHFDEDVSLNTSLQYMLENQYGIKIPEYNDDNIEEYFNSIEKMISNLGWKLEREARISTFSFNKLNMYLDLDNNKDKIIKNPNIGAITNSLGNSDIFINEEELNQLAEAKDLFLKQHNVVDADFSQTEAIEYAMMGKSFVLQGPPGTGKSQTITNMIAELIYAGKKVLFVSEKMAALEVVYNNLKKTNLSDFCLELHSYKANKKDFVEDLYNTLNTPKTLVKEIADDNLYELIDKTNKINEYDKELYKIYEPINMSLYQLIGLANHYSYTKEVPYIIKNIDSMGIDVLNKNINDLDKYSLYEKTIGYNYKDNPLYGLAITDSSYQNKIKIKEYLEECKNSSNNLFDELIKIKNNYNITLTDTNEIEKFIDFIKYSINNNFVNKSLLNDVLIDQLIKNIDELSLLEKNINDTKNKLLLKYNENIFDEDVKEIYDDFTIYGNSFFKRLFNSNFKRANNKLASLSVNHKKIKYELAIDDLRLMIKRNMNIDKYNELSKMYEKYSIKQFDYLNTNWNEMKDLLINLKTKLTNINLISKESINDINYESYNDNDINILEDVYNSYKNAIDNIKPFIDTEIYNLDDYYIHDVINVFDKLIDGLPYFDVWVEFYRLFIELKNNNLLPFIDLVIKLNYKLNNISDYYRLCFYRQWIDEIFINNPRLNDYTRYQHDIDIKSFKEKDKTQLKISKARINEKLSKMRPDPMLQMTGSPANIIVREHEKKRKLKPIRVLMNEIPEFIQELKPCFLMSPLSVSTFLSDDINFDVTIFDEASQVFPEDAIVAIYRSKQLIVVGDSKQMPPTKFFISTDNNDDDYDDEISDIDSYESILDLCSTSFPTKSLLCHYRSRDEGLINFSNKNFYKYNLVTYPSVYENKKDLGVDFIYVNDGVMDFKAKANLVEAERVVDLIFEHYKKYPERSLGVVAFNIKQQDVILKLLEKRRLTDSSIEEYLKDDVKEPFFVKNLETVQGDERDTIIFSISYAKNEKGQFAMRFGPLNLAGGERRLNVAITRAKLNVKVVSSIKANDIDVDKVTNLGPKLLHDYLDYAEHGINSLSKAISDENSEIDSLFEEDVYNFLKANGFDVDRGIGSSKYRIDLGIKRPNTNDFVLAIECDGATYHNNKSTRDRDRLRESILKDMDWNYYRIWSTDWYKNNTVEKKALLDACKLALGDDNIVIPNNDEKNVDVSDYIESANIKGSVSLFDEYVSYDGELFKDPIYMARLYADTEGPVSVDYLLKKICSIYGYDKPNSKVKDLFLNDFKSDINFYIENGFIYTKNQKRYAMRENIGSILKNIDYVSEFEIRNGMYQAIDLNMSCKKEELFAFIRNHLGFNRVGDKMNNKFELAYLLLKPYINIDFNGIITINKDKPLRIIKRSELKKRLINFNL